MNPALIPFLPTIGGAVKEVLDRVLPDKGKAAEAKLAYDSMVQNGEITVFNTAADLDKNTQDNITSRWVADASSTEWLARNIRPLAVLLILALFVVFSFSSAFGLKVEDVYAQTLSDWGNTCFIAYFGLRTTEKVMPFFSNMFRRNS